MIKVSFKDLSKLLDLIVDDASSSEFIKTYSKSDFMGHQLFFKLSIEENWCHFLLQNHSLSPTYPNLFDLHIKNIVAIYFNLETKTITIEQEDKTIFIRVFLDPYITIKIQKAMREEYIYRTESI